jgi:hypothetical protein
LRGKLGRLTACHDPLHHLGCEKHQRYQPADVSLADSVALGDLDLRSAIREIVEPAVARAIDEGGLALQVLTMRLASKTAAVDFLVFKLALGRCCHRLTFAAFADR